jgi:hypothetical protein
VTTPVQGVQSAGAPPANKNAPPPKPYPFPVGVYESGVQDYDNVVALGATATAWASPVQAPLWNLSPTGWLRGAWFDFTYFFSGAGNAAGAFAEDGPFSGIQKITLYDLGGEVVFQLTGYEWYLTNKFGGYFEVGDPRADITFLANPTAGNSELIPLARYLLYLPLEAVARDALGTVQNESKPGWKLEVWFDTATNFVGLGGTPLTGAAATPVCHVRGYMDSYTEPAAAAPNGRPFSQTPPLPGTLQYWKSENVVLPSGSAKFDISNGVGFPIRNIIYYARATADSKRVTLDPDFNATASNWPDPATLLVGNVNYFTRGRSLWISKMSKAFALSAVGTNGKPVAATAGYPPVNTAEGRESAVFPVWFTQDMHLIPGAELRFKYLDTQVNSLIRFTGSFGAASTFFAMVNWLATPSQNRYALIAG